jgi:hypothetical protein
VKENEYDDDDDDDDDDDEDEGDYDDEDEDPLTDEQRLEESKKIFQMFAAKLFEQRVVSAYREKGKKRVEEKKTLCACCFLKMKRKKSLLAIKCLQFTIQNFGFNLVALEKQKKLLEEEEEEKERIEQQKRELQQRKREQQKLKQKLRKQQQEEERERKRKEEEERKKREREGT